MPQHVFHGDSDRRENDALHSCIRMLASAGIYEFSRRRKSDGGRRRRAVGASKLGQSNATPICLSSRENAERRERLNNRQGR